MHNFVVRGYAGTPEHDGYSNTSPLLEDLYVGSGAHSKFRQVSSLPCLLVSPMSSVRVSSSTISPGCENSMVFSRHVGGRQPGLFVDFKLLCDLSFPESTYYLYGFVVRRLLVPTGMATSDLLLRLLLLLAMLLDCIFSSLAPS